MKQRQTVTFTFTVQWKWVIGTAANQFNLPWNICLDSNLTRYIADSSNSRIQKWLYGASSGTTIAGTTINRSSSTQLSNPRTVWPKGNNIYVADSGNNRVQMFINGFTTGVTVLHTVVMWNPGQSSETVVAATSGSPGPSSTQFHFPTSVVGDSFRNFWVVDNNNHRVQFFYRSSTNTTAGRTVAGGSSGTGASQLYYPVGLALDSTLNLYVADTSIIIAFNDIKDYRESEELH